MVNDGGIDGITVIVLCELAADKEGKLTPVQVFDLVLACPPQRSGQLVCSPSHHWSSCTTDQLRVGLRNDQTIMARRMVGSNILLVVKSTELGSNLVAFCAATTAASSEVNRTEASMVAVAMEENERNRNLSRLIIIELW